MGGFPFLKDRCGCGGCGGGWGGFGGFGGFGGCGGGWGGCGCNDRKVCCVTAVRACRSEIIELQSSISGFRKV